MKTRLKRIVTNINFITTSIVLLAYFAIRFKKIFLKAHPAGDETGFLEVFNFYVENGYSETLSKGSSIIFNFMTSFFNLFVENPLYALRMTSLFFGISALIIAVKIQKTFFPLKKEYALLFLITSSSMMVVSSIFLSGINDTILYFLGTVFVYFLLKFHRDKKISRSSIVIGLVLGFMILTRKMALIYFPLVILLLLLLYSNIKINLISRLKSVSIISIVTIAIIVMFNIPNISNGEGLSFHEKKLDDEISWIQLQYLTALKESEGGVEEGQHVSIEYVKQYIAKNGKESLPDNSFTSVIFFDVGFTVKQFFKNAFKQIIPITRLSGLLILFLLLGAVLTVKKERYIRSLFKQEYITIFLFSLILILCVISINYIEPRWYIGVLILLPLPVYSILQKRILETKKNELFNFLLINGQLALVIAMNAPYILSNYKHLL